MSACFSQFPAQARMSRSGFSGSSIYSAHLAAALGLPYAFASHFAPDMLHEALDIYRDKFTPSAQLDAPYVMAATMGVMAG
jgi:alkanesulfonate monooxygenase SsuD/methylene tetrahydromethanopterin reductase-like flavin-dependent oxidoreductase (luciferase family)